MNAPSRLLTADPKANYLAHAEEIRAAIDRVLASGHYVLGPEVEEFESEFSRYQENGYTVTVANGTDALELALRAVGVGQGDRVATVANTVTATVAAILSAGAEPVYVEIDPETMVMHPDALADVLTRGPVKAVVPVHLYGQPADMPRIIEIATRHGCAVVEDCAQAHGASIGGRKVGTWGQAAAFSFYPTKNLGALGDGGAVYTRDAAIAERVRLLRQYGWRRRYVAEMEGRNSRLDEIQAAVLRVKLRHLDAENAHRRRLANCYRERIERTDIKVPQALVGGEHVYHQFTIRTPQRDVLRTYLDAEGIACGILYPVPVHRQPAHSCPSLTLPATERVCAEVLCLPCHPQIAIEEVDLITRKINAGTWS